MARANAQVARQQFLGADGRPLSGGKLYIFEAGSTQTAATVWMDHDTSQDNQHDHPIELDSRGQAPAPIVLESGKPYRFELRDANDVFQWDEDRVQAVGSDEPDLTAVSTLLIESEANNALRVAGGVQVANRQVVKADGLIAAATVETDSIADDAVTGDKIADGTITGEKLAPGAVPNTLSAGSVETEHLADNAVTEAKMALASVGTPELKVRSVTNPKIGLQAVQAENLKDRHVTGDKLELASIRAEHFSSGARASDLEAQTGTNTTKFVTPDHLRRFGAAAFMVMSLGSQLQLPSANRYISAVAVIRVAAAENIVATVMRTGTTAVSGQLALIPLDGRAPVSSISFNVSPAQGMSESKTFNAPGAGRYAVLLSTNTSFVRSGTLTLSRS